MSPKWNHKRPYKRDRRRPDLGREEVMTECCDVGPQVKEGGGLEKVEKVRKQFFPRSLQKEQSPVTTVILDF